VSESKTPTLAEVWTDDTADASTVEMWATGSGPGAVDGGDDARDDVPVDAPSTPGSDVEPDPWADDDAPPEQAEQVDPEVAALAVTDRIPADEFEALDLHDAIQEVAPRVPRPEDYDGSQQVLTNKMLRLLLNQVRVYDFKLERLAKRMDEIVELALRVHFPKRDGEGGQQQMAYPPGWDVTGTPDGHPGKSDIAGRKQREQESRDRYSLIYKITQAMERSGIESAPSCPQCGKTLQIRLRKRDNNPFFGCPGYPDCRVTKNIDLDAIGMGAPSRSEQEAAQVEGEANEF